MGLFIQYALAATQFAVGQAELQITPEFAERIGCLHRLRHRRI